MNDKILEGKAAIILDLDGTLGKLDVDWTSSRGMFKEYSLAEFGVEFEDGMRLDEMEAYLLNKFGIESFDKIFCKRRTLESDGISESSLNMDLVERMKHWKGQGIKIAVHSNNLIETVYNFLSFHKLIEFVDVYIGVSLKIPPKPDTEGLKRILEQMGVSARDAIFIGDNMSTDGEVAKRMDVCYLHIKI